MTGSIRSDTDILVYAGMDMFIHLLKLGNAFFFLGWFSKKMFTEVTPMTLNIYRASPCPDESHGAQGCPDKSHLGSERARYLGPGTDQ